MDDTLDVLRIPRDSQSTPSKKKPRAKPKRPEGLSREAYSLLDGHHPVVQTTPYKKLLVRKDTPTKKRKTEGLYTVSYKWTTFTNEARNDGFKLKRWVKCFTDKQGKFRQASTTEYQFAKLNKKPDVIRYSEAEWKNCLAPLSVDWSREETDYLLDLCQQFSLRFPVIHDRYNYNGKEDGRSYDELKERYYGMVYALACYRSSDELSSLYILKHPYDGTAERRRREACEKLLNMSWEEEWKDNEILEEAERIEVQRLEGATITPIVSSEDEESDASLTEILSGFDQADSFPMHDRNAQPFTPEPGVYLRGHFAKNLMADTMSGSEERVLKDFSVDACFPTICSKKLIKSWIELRNDAKVLTKLRDAVEAEMGRKKDAVANS